MSAQADVVTDLQPGETKTYIVQLADEPLVAFNGGDGLAATAPKAGEKVDVDSAAAQAYTSHLDAQRAEVLDTIGLSSSDVVTTYDTALSGFAVKMNNVEAAHMAKAPGVVQVWEDEVRHADTVQTPDYLGLSGEGGVWDTQFGGVDNAGDGIIVGVIDTGIDPNNPSFSGEGFGEAPEDWAGSCDEAGVDQYAAFECNNKIIGARFYGTDYGNPLIPEEFESARDYNGHGSHTAGTAAGNNDVPLSILGADLGNASGMAPAAQIAVYKGLWMTADGTGSGTTAGLVAAIDDAVADGVDVINYSISGSSTSIVGADEVAFLYAADAGIFVSTSAGNSGDTVGVSSVAHNAPWTMTVAASTHNRGAQNSVTLGDGASFDGVGYGGPLAATALVNAEDIPAEGADVAEANLCAPGTVDDAGAAGKIVVCTRGAYALVDKGTEVINSGGAGMIMINDPAGAAGQNAIIYGLPATHLTAEDGVLVKAYAATEGATAEFSATENTTVNAPEMASFSSYGPALAGGGDLLKPDITGPGVDIAAAYHADHSDPGQPTFDQISGTSMSAPHIAGLGALLKQQYPDWSPAAIKSAMMTTARDVDDAGDPIKLLGEEASPLNYGAGEVRPAPSYNPGLVYDAGWDEWLNYACSIGQATDCAEDIDPSDMNYPSISIGKLAGIQTVTRTVTDVTGEGGTYTAEVEAPEGLTVTVEPSTIEVPANGTASFEVTIEAATAEVDTYHFAQLRLVNGDIVVESPIAVQPTALAAPAEVSGTVGEGGTVERQGGADRYETATLVAAQFADDADTVYIATGDEYADALAGSAPAAGGITPGIAPAEALAAAPVLLSRPDHLPAVTAEALEAIKPSNIVLLGGNSAIDDATAAEIAEFGEVTRVEGANRYETSVSIAQMYGAVDKVYVASGENYPDALTGAALAGHEGYPVVLTQNDNVPNVLTDYLASEDAAGAEVVVLGGSVAVSDAVTEELGATRLAGDDRWGTAVEISKAFGVDSPETTLIASGQNWPDALSGSALAASVGVPVLLTQSDNLPNPIGDELERLTSQGAMLLGGLQAVGQQPEDEVRAIVEGEGQSVSYEAVTGFEGTITAEVDGLVAAEVLPVEVTSDGPGGGAGIADVIVPVTVPEGTSTLRVSTFAAETDPADIDIDLYLANSEGAVIAQSAVGGSDESITLHGVDPGEYLVALDYWDGAAGATATVPTYVWTVGDAAEGNLTITPESADATIGGVVDYTAAWSGLEAGVRYLGAVNYSDGTDPVGKTLVSINP
nr:S8 family serine peptidase [Ornithinimicrobium sp. HY1793]